MVACLTTSDMGNLVDSFALYLREERMRGASTIKRYVGVMEDFAIFLTTEHPNGPFALEAVEKEHLVRFLRREATETEEPSRAIWNTRLPTCWRTIRRSS